MNEIKIINIQDKNLEANQNIVNYKIIRFSHYKIKSCERYKTVMSKNRVTTIAQMMEYKLNKIGISDETSTYVVEDLGIKRSDIMKGMTKDE